MVQLLLLISNIIFSQTDTLTYNTVISYRDWQWEARVVENKYITMAIVPSMGGNILQYDFGVDTFLITNPATYGQIYDPVQGQSPFNGDWGFGGFEVWSTPEQWPPSPILTFGLYDVTLLFQTADSLKIKLTSKKEINSFPGIRYEKLYTAYKNSTLIKFQNSIINEGAGPIEIGMMNVAEISSQHSSLMDYHNFKSYFPIKRNSIFGNQCVRISPASTAFKGEIAPGVYGVEYTPLRGKVFADSPEGWMAFVDERDTQTYVCIYDVFDGAKYPDQGANTEVFIENNLAFMALEAISPMANLNSLTDTLRYTEYLASTRMNGPVLKANIAGVVGERLKYDSTTHRLTGKYGVFSNSKLQLLYCDSLNNILEEGKIFSAAPDSQLIIDELVELSLGAKIIKLRAYNLSGGQIADLDEEDFKEKEFVCSSTGLYNNQINHNKTLGPFYMSDNEINIELNLLHNDDIKIDLINMMGIVVDEFFEGHLTTGKHYLNKDLPKLSKGVYFVRFIGTKTQYSERIIYR